MVPELLNLDLGISTVFERSLGGNGGGGLLGTFPLTLNLRGVEGLVGERAIFELDREIVGGTFGEPLCGVGGVGRIRSVEGILPIELNLTKPSFS